ncbi:hypothetical protein GCM10008965_16480 [Methylorubrum aminovorans]
MPERRTRRRAVVSVSAGGRRRCRHAVTKQIAALKANGRSGPGADVIRSTYEGRDTDEARAFTSACHERSDPLWARFAAIARDTRHSLTARRWRAEFGPLTF